MTYSNQTKTRHTFIHKFKFQLIILYEYGKREW